MLNYDYIQFLNEKVLEYLPSNRVRVGDKINFRCPLCGDSHKSALKKRGWWYLRSGSFYCFNCSTGMSGIKFLEHISGESYENIRHEYFRLFLKSGISPSLSASYDIPADEPGIFQLKSIINPAWKNPLSDKAKAYLESRKVLDAPFLADRLYSCYNTARSEEFILIPWILNGCEAYYQVNDFQHLHPMKYIFPKDKKKLIAGLDNVDVSWPYIICFEGFYDSVFVKNGVCLGTKAITDYQLRLIKERFPKHQIVISFDNDKAGFESTARLLRRKNDFKYLKWYSPSTKEKDINEIVLANGDVNTFADEKNLEQLIVDKLLMKMYLIKNGRWTISSEEQKEEHTSYGSKGQFWKTRQIQ